MNSSVLGLWLIPTTSSIKPITKQENEWAQQLPSKRATQYKHARGYARQALSNLFQIPALEIPLYAEPGKIPQLPKALGSISFSHCADALLIGWSPSPIGVDIERSDRAFAARPLINRFFSKNDQHQLKNLKGENLRSSTLELWIVKEAAIKWHQGRISLHLQDWEWHKDSSCAINQSIKSSVDIFQVNFDSWKIAVAFNRKKHPNSPIICYDKSTNII